MNEEQDVWNRIVDFNEKYFPGWRQAEYVFYSNAIAGEAGELCNSVKHLAGGGTHKLNVTTFDLMDELADLFVYIVLMSETVGFPRLYFYETVKRKMEKNEIRMKEAWREL